MCCGRGTDTAIKSVGNRTEWHAWILIKGLGVEDDVATQLVHEKLKYHPPDYECTVWNIVCTSCADERNLPRPGLVAGDGGPIDGTAYPTYVQPDDDVAAALE